MVAIGEHYRPTAGGESTGEGSDGEESDGESSSETVPPGVYRVVGTGDPLALLRVGDADGRRVTTGDLRRVDATALEAAFEPADDPDAGLSPIRGLRNAATGFYWQFRRFL